MLWQWDSENILTIAFTVFLITATQSKYNFQVTKIRNTLKAYNFSLFHVCATVEKRAPSISSLPCTKWGYKVKSINSTDENHCNQWWTLQSFLWMKMRSQSQFTILRVLSVKITISLRQSHSAFDFASGVIRIWLESQDIALNQLILIRKFGPILPLDLGLQRAFEVRICVRLTFSMPRTYYEWNFS